MNRFSAFCIWVTWCLWFTVLGDTILWALGVSSTADFVNDAVPTALLASVIDVLVRVCRRRN